VFVVARHAGLVAAGAQREVAGRQRHEDDAGGAVEHELSAGFITLRRRVGFAVTGQVQELGQASGRVPAKW
jgi:hypothetical protein